jgi:hypothetical protein
MCRLSRNSGASSSWNPKGLSRPVAGKLYLYCSFTLLVSFHQSSILTPLSAMLLLTEAPKGKALGPSSKSDAVLEIWELQERIIQSLFPFM